MSWELLLPMTKRMPLYVVGQEEVPWAMRSYVAGAFGTGAIPISEIGHIYGGRAAMPVKPIMVYGPSGQVVTLVVGGGETEAAELEELAYENLEAQQVRPMNDRISEYRERMGLPPREKMPALISQALRDHGRDQIANPSKYPKKPKPDKDRYRHLPELTERGMRWQ